jgi:hypothetical protein
MSDLISTITIDAVTSVSERCVAEGEHDRASRDQFVDASAMLLGRKTYEGRAQYWSPLTGEWAEQLNAMPKRGSSSRTGVSTKTPTGHTPVSGTRRPTVFAATRRATQLI